MRILLEGFQDVPDRDFLDLWIAYARLPARRVNGVNGWDSTFTFDQGVDVRVSLSVFFRRIDGAESMVKAHANTSSQEWARVVKTVIPPMSHLKMRALKIGNLVRHFPAWIQRNHLADFTRPYPMNAHILREEVIDRKVITVRIMRDDETDFPALVNIWITDDKRVEAFVIQLRCNLRRGISRVRDQEQVLSFRIFPRRSLYIRIQDSRQIPGEELCHL